MPIFTEPVLGNDNNSKDYAVAGTQPNFVGANHSAVFGDAFGPQGNGVYGRSHSGIGGKGESRQSHGVYGVSLGHDGIKGETHKEGFAGVAGFNFTKTGFGIWGKGGKWAGAFEGNVLVTGTVQHGNGDCAEDFDITEESVEPGTVMVLNEMGSLQPSYKEYDKKVAGIISGASGYKPAIVLDRQQSETQNQKKQARLPIALLGKVYCKVDATHSPIEIGDLLTTSSTMGYAMKAEDPMKAFGTVIGKALGSIKEGLGMIPVLVALQ
jgi:hypothetical protein